MKTGAEHWKNLRTQSIGMTVCRQNNFFRVIGKEPYHIINLFFVAVILLVFAYSGIFSPEKNNYPVVCFHEKITGQPCFSCGLSHSFSLIMQGKIAEANQWNPYGFRVFLFFIAQLVFRINFTRLSINYPNIRKQLIIYDVFASLFVFSISFWPFITNIVELLL
jgi:hypothetical protein